MMRLIILLAITVMLVTQTVGQNAVQYYNKGMAFAYKGKFKKSLRLLDKSVRLDDQNFDFYYGRGLIKLLLDQPKAAIIDFDLAINVNPTYEMAFLQRGFGKELITNYQGAMDDYTMALDLNPNFSAAYYYRGALFELLEMREQACNDFEEAYLLGDERANFKRENCLANDTLPVKLYSILRLTERAFDDSYGVSPINPVKVGMGPNGGLGNQEAYLNLLRDGQGKRLNYTREGSCCPYSSENGTLGIALVDRYKVTFRTQNNRKKTIYIYISFYDYEDPKIIEGFSTITPY